MKGSKWTALVCVSLAAFQWTSVALGDGNFNRTEAAKSMGHALGRLMVLPAAANAFIPYCSVDNSHSKFFKSFDIQLTAEVLPILEKIRAMHREFSHEAYGPAATEIIFKTMSDATSSGYQDLKEKLSRLPPSERQEVCGNYRKQIIDGHWDTQQYADLYLTSLKRLSPRHFSKATEAFQLLKQRQLNLTERINKEE